MGPVSADLLAKLYVLRFIVSWWKKRVDLSFRRLKYWYKVSQEIEDRLSIRDKFAVADSPKEPLQRKLVTGYLLCKH